MREARRLGLPIIGLVDTNCDPDEADYVIPGNDDAIRSCSLVIRAIAEAIEAGKSQVRPEEFEAAAAANGQPEEPEAAPEAEPEPGAGGRARAGRGAPEPSRAADEPPAEQRARGTGGERRRDRGRGGRRSRRRRRPMAEIPATLVKQLRDETGAGMMDAKRALQETEGDLDAAKRLLRERGMAEAGKRAGRETTEGIVLARVDERVGTLVAVGCETEPVSKNDEFRAFAREGSRRRRAGRPGRGRPARGGAAGARRQARREHRRRGAARFEKQGDDEVLAAYVHPPANKIGVLVRAKGPAEVARLLAMHIAFAAPLYAHRDEISEEDLATELEILEKLPEVQSRPEEHREKIVEGMLSKRFFGQTVLPDQEWIHDTGKTVAKALEEHELEVLEYERYALAG